ncbi:hypothetical protein DFH07DRAFT_1055548 [Mycena maculata]|uniref:Uncharacterized protein n=1 Tax=Mycena maculata TaxID=230809 RepID=A0AAD7NZQ6_9AGAR|nr:hypothetical protein DFH07DRAFT_1055548 [Mycena maculata]
MGLQGAFITSPDHFCRTPVNWAGKSGYLILISKHCTIFFELGNPWLQQVVVSICLCITSLCTFVFLLNTFSNVASIAADRMRTLHKFILGPVCCLKERTNNTD